jgi:A/G-specific adenine glycosylase
MISGRNAAKIAARVEEWFDANGRDLPWRNGYDPYHVWISEFMAQQTRMEVVLRHLPPFLERFSTIHELAGAGEEDVVAAWSGLGYYRRARMLHRSAREIVERFDGRLPDDVDTLRSLHGFGPYTAGAVASIAFDRRAPIADGNVIRIVARLERVESPWRSRPLEARAWEVAALLVDRCRSPRALNQGLMELGARVCRPKNPDCGSCPVARYCEARSAGVVSDLPRAAAKVKTIELEVPVWVFSDTRGRVLLRRSDGRLMKGMFQFPVGVDDPFGDSIEIRNPGPEVGRLTHTITNRRIRFALHAPEMPDRLADSSGEWRWVDPDRLDDHPHPSWVRKVLDVWARAKRSE